MTKVLTIDGVTIKKGERKYLEMHIAKLFDNTEMTIPVEVIRGKEDGPTLFISSAIHGDEINGVETIRRLLQRKKLLSSIKGTLIAVPIINVFGYNRNLRYLPDRRDLNRVFPGSKKGSLASQIAYKFMKEIVEKCDYGIDLHTGSAHRYNLPQIRAFLDNKEIKALAESFGVPVVLHSNMRDGSLRQAATDKGVKILLFEGGEALRYNEEIIRSAENGILWTMCNIGMLDKELVKRKIPRRREVFHAASSHWIRAPHSGSLYAKKNVGHKVKANEVLGFISDPLGKEKHYVRARETGVIIGITMMPLVTNGDALFHVATFENAEAVAEGVEDYQEDLE
ncbi:MAG: succinylglutamate desuccinylase/aspartoacylase family protein [Rickettsiaceae bacterium]|jgi:predicted deacylase|nr:succinylglutamate desuccinylase/aspartoacylase family protein [Rickettsiaceae bacterium]